MTETCEMPRREIGLPYQVAPSIHPAGARVFGGCAMKLPYRSIPQMSEKDIARFWAKVDKRKDSECWLWNGRRDRLGYAKMDIRRHHTGGNNYPAARIAMMITTGECNPMLMVCHHCDNPPCVNPAHLFLGTALDNNRDSFDKGRAVKFKGNQLPQAILTPDAVREIRRLWATRRSVKDPMISRKTLATRFGVSPWAIKHVILREWWRHIA